MNIIEIIDSIAYGLSPTNLEMGRFYLSSLAIVVISAIIIYKRKIYHLIK